MVQEDDDRGVSPVWMGAIALLVLLAIAGAGWLFYVSNVTSGTEAIIVMHSDGDPVGTLDPNETYEQAPALARGLDELLEGEADQVWVTRDEATYNHIADYLQAELGDTNDPFTWRGEVVRAEQSID